MEKGGSTGDGGGGEQEAVHGESNRATASRGSAGGRFLARHPIGTLTGALVTYLISSSPAATRGVGTMATEIQMRHIAV